MKLAVLSNEEQYNAFSGALLKSDEVKVLCDNPAFHAFLKSKGVDFDILSEKNIKQNWGEINTWACEKALLWDRLITDKSLFGGIELNKALYVYFSLYLVSFLKNYLYAELIGKKYAPSEIIIFDNIYCPPFPLLDGNYFLNMFLKDLAKKNDIKTTLLSLKAIRNTKITVSKKEKIKALICDAYSRLSVSETKKKVFVVCGALRHLDLVVGGLRKRRKKIVYYDFDFNLEQFVFCLKRNLRYLVPQCVRKGGYQHKTDVIDWEEDLMEAVRSLRSRAWFSYKDADLTPLVCDELSSRTGQYLDDVSLWSSDYKRILNEYEVEGLILDEDESPRRGFMAAFFKSRGVRTFCVSHGYGPVKFSLRNSDRTFFLSETFVHSGYEKKLYSSRGWDEKHLHITGVPKCDKLVRLKKKKSSLHKRLKPMKIMFCGSTLHGFTPQDCSYVGESEMMWGNNMKNCLKDIMRAIGGYNIELIVRPHSWHVDDKNLWLDLIEDNKGKNKVRLASTKTEFFKLLSECDAMILGYWSTAVMEGVILGISTIVLDYTGLEDKHDFGKQGLCEVLQSFDQLKATIHNLYLSFRNRENEDLFENIKDQSFYRGLNDGRNTQRAIENILNMQAI